MDVTRNEVESGHLTYTLEMRQLTDEGVPTGPLIELAKVDTSAGLVTGPLAVEVRQILARERVRLGVVGESVRIDAKRAWLVAYAMTMDNGALQRAGYENPGSVLAFDSDRVVIAMPERHLDNFEGCIVDSIESDGSES